MSPDLRSDDAYAIDRAKRALARRMRALAIVEAVAWAAAAGVALSSTSAAILAGAVVAAWRWRQVRDAAIVRAIEQADGSSRNVFISAGELIDGRLTTSDGLRARVLADAAAVARRIDRASIAPAAPALRAVVAAALVGLVSMTLPLWRGRIADVASIVRGRATGNSAAAAAPLGIRATVQPPGYTGLQSSTVDDPEQLHAVEGSTLSLAIETPDPVTVDHDGASATLTRTGDRSFSYRVRLDKTGFLVVSAAGTRRTIPIVVSPDALPSVRIAAPGRDLVYAGDNARVTFAARATDDFGLRSLRLRYTKVSGSGENFAFQDGEIPLDITRETPRDWSGRATRSLADLNLQEGDILVYRAVAADAREDTGTGGSDAFFIEISKLGVAAGDAFTLPEQETRYALSQQMLIVKTERLQQRRQNLSAPDFKDEALNLSVEQRMIRAEIVFMLGGEVENEEVEAEQSNELQEGRLANRGQRDLRAATIAMSQAEKLLAGANTAEALVAERAAVAALQRAFARDRYILRALASRTQLDLTRRLTGVLTGAAEWRRSVPDAPANRRAALLQDLLRGLSALRAGTTGAFSGGARVLAAEAIRIDPASSALRQVATELQRAAASEDAEARARFVAAANSAAAAEARRAHADPTLDATTPAPRLAGAFADAAARLKASRSVSRGLR